VSLKRQTWPSERDRGGHAGGEEGHTEEQIEARRCQRITVSGLTMTIALRLDGKNRYRQTKVSRSMFRSRTRDRDLRLKTITCCRKAKFSASRLVRDCSRDRATSRSLAKNANIAPSSFRNSLPSLLHLTLQPDHLTPTVDGLTLTYMRTLHTFAIAFAGGWLLLNPPLGDTKAPLNQWTVYHPKSSRSTTFESNPACLAAMDALRHPPSPSDPNAGSAKGVQPTTSFDHLVCVPSDDPRLKK
jgi:hypothetical protein